MGSHEAGGPGNNDSNGPQQDRSVNGWNAEYVEGLYRRWQEDASAVGADWNQFFLGFSLGRQQGESGQPVSTGGSTNWEQGRVDSLIYHYRDIGHFAARLDPLGTQRPFPENLTLESFSLGDDALDQMFDPGTLPLENPSSLRSIIEHLERTYCRHIGAEYMHIQDRERRRWLQRRMETVQNRPEFPAAAKRRLLDGLIAADGFEAFLRKRYVGKKRFGLEGGESLIPLLDQIIELGPANGIKEFAIGMAHRGRLNVMVNILKKSYEQTFTDFEESWMEDYIDGGGDVKYHLGYSNTHITEGGQEVHLTLAPNPSHLEFVTSVVMGRCRAKQRLQGDEAREQVIPLIIHGDAAFPGQGVVAECFNMMSLDGYTVGGTIHLVLNNQVGFTTDQRDSFSGKYCTDIAKMIDAPIFHVNGDDPEACAWVARMALEYRQAFKNDVVIDMWCYRKNGHNESDEPSFTQPLMYKLIREKTPVLDVYESELVRTDVISAEESTERKRRLADELEAAQTRSKQEPVDPTINPFKSIWSGVQGEHVFQPIDTTVDEPTLQSISRAISELPEGFNLHKTVARGFKGRSIPAEDVDAPIEWGTAELLAYGSLLLENHAVRLSGQDVERGTFSHRHSVVHDQTTGEPWIGLNHIADEQERFCVHNSPLTECAVVGFEYGYSLTDPNMLIIWEAQFGDFANGAQVIFDQFVASAERKWQRSTGLVLFLPHGYEGQGPEHSSARLERFLSLCADNNMQICYPSTGAQLFHMLRRQVKQPFRKPLVVMTPKSMLRLPQAKSTTRELTEGQFQCIIDDSGANPEKVEELLLCTGKVFYELDKRRDELGRDDVAIIRIEQLYPLDIDSLREIVEGYPLVRSVRWVQEEPENSGAWRFMKHLLDEKLGMQLTYVGREENASPAVGSLLVSNREHGSILDEALGTPPTGEANSDVEKKPAASREKAANRSGGKRRRRASSKGPKKKAS